MPSTAVPTCPLCGSPNGRPFSVHTQEQGGSRRCAARQCDCGLQYLEDYAISRDAVYDDSAYGAWGTTNGQEDAQVADAKRTAFREQLLRLLAHVPDPTGKRLLDIGTGMGYLLDEAAAAGFDVSAVEISAFAAASASARFPGKITQSTLAAARFPDASFDVITMTDLLEHVADPLSLFGEVRRLLAPGGHLFIITPDTDSWTRRLLGARWFQYKHEHVTYWNRAAITVLLGKFGFSVLDVRRNRKRFSLAYYARYFQKYSLLGAERVFNALYGLLPPSAQQWSFSNPVTGEVLVVAKRDTLG